MKGKALPASGSCTEATKAPQKVSPLEDCETMWPRSEIAGSEQRAEALEAGGSPTRRSPTFQLTYKGKSIFWTGYFKLMIQTDLKINENCLLGPDRNKVLSRKRALFPLQKIKIFTRKMVDYFFNI